MSATPEIIKVVHFTDIHMDHKYEVGSDMDCNMPLCCHAIDGYPTESYRQAGRWGSYPCDLPERSLRSMLQFIKTDIQPAAIIWTGDNAPHNLWESSVDEVIASTKNITDIIKEELRDIAIQFYPIQGNHDVFPVNVQDFSMPYSNEAIKGHAKEWFGFGWLDGESIFTFKKWGYYSQKPTFLSTQTLGNTYVIGLNT